MTRSSSQNTGRSQAQSAGTVHSWSEVAQHLMTAPPGAYAMVDKGTVHHPKTIPSWRRSTGLAQEGVKAHWRVMLPDGRCLHAVERKSDYLVHVDLVDPGQDFLGHLGRDTPGLLSVLLLLVGGGGGAGVGWLATGTREGTATGAATGSACAALFLALLNEPDRQMTAQFGPQGVKFCMGARGQKLKEDTHGQG